MVHLDKANGDVKVSPQTPPALQWPRKLRLRDCLLERQWDYSRRVAFGIPTDSFVRQIPDFPNFLALTPYLGSGTGARVAGWWLSFSPMTLGKACSLPETLFSSVNMGKDSCPGTRLLGESWHSLTRCSGVKKLIIHQGALGPNTEGSVFPLRAFPEHLLRPSREARSWGPMLTQPGLLLLSSLHLELVTTPRISVSSSPPSPL